jgi:hypothetical protein
MLRRRTWDRVLEEYLDVFRQALAEHGLGASEGGDGADGDALSSAA